MNLTYRVFVFTTQKYLRRASLLLLRHLASHPSTLPHLTSLPPALVSCILSTPIPEIREQAAWCLGIIARSGKEEAQRVWEAGGCKALVECMREAEGGVRRVACAAGGDLVRWGVEVRNKLKWERIGDGLGGGGLTLSSFRVVSYFSGFKPLVYFRYSSQQRSYPPPLPPSRSLQPSSVPPPHPYEPNPFPS